MQKCIVLSIIMDVFQVTPPDEPVGTKILRLSILLMEKKHARPGIYESCTWDKLPNLNWFSRRISEPSTRKGMIFGRHLKVNVLFYIEPFLQPPWDDESHPNLNGKTDRSEQI